MLSGQQQQECSCFHLRSKSGPRQHSAHQRGTGLPLFLCSFVFLFFLIFFFFVCRFQELEAQYDEDGLWYRAKITKLESANKIQVAFTAYGNSQWCGIGQVRPLVEYVEGMHVQARYDEDEQW